MGFTCFTCLGFLLFEEACTVLQGDCPFLQLLESFVILGQLVCKLFSQSHYPRRSWVPFRLRTRTQRPCIEMERLLFWVNLKRINLLKPLRGREGLFIEARKRLPLNTLQTKLSERHMGVPRQKIHCRCIPLPICKLAIRGDLDMSKAVASREEDLAK